jgi:membrane protein required for colicin V production
VDWVDAAIVVVLLFFIVTAFNAGFIREIIGMASVIGGLALAGVFYDDVADSLLTNIDNETAKSALAFIIIFGGVSVAGQLVALIVRPAAILMQLGIADQLLGAGFGAVKGFVVVQALLILMVTYPRFDMDERINDSEFASLMLEVATPVLSVLPREFDNHVDAFRDGTLPSLVPDSQID